MKALPLLTILFLLGITPQLSAQKSPGKTLFPEHSKPKKKTTQKPTTAKENKKVVPSKYYFYTIQEGVGFYPLPSFQVQDDISYLPINTKCTFIDNTDIIEQNESGDSYPWFKVEVDGIQGYVYSGYLAESPVEEEVLIEEYEDESVPALTFPISAYFNSGNVRIREYPSLQATILGKGNEYQACEILEMTDYTEYVDGFGTYPWYRILIDGKVGWVFGRFLSY